MRNIYPLTNYLKKKIYIKIYNNKAEIFNENYLYENIKNINNIDIEKLLNKPTNKCIFLNKNIAWFGIDKSEKKRYFSKGILTYGLDIYDILMIYFNCDYYNVLKKLKTIGCETDKNLNIKNGELKYTKNKIVMSQFLLDNKKISKYLNSTIDIWEALNDYGLNNLNGGMEYKGENLFFVSIRYLKEKYGINHSISTISKALSYYNELGLINKVQEEEKEPFIYKWYSKSSKAKIGFYSINNLENNIETIKENFNKLCDKNITLYKIKSTSKNRGGGDKKESANKNTNNIIILEDLFNLTYSEQGFISKELLIKNNPDISINLINDFWLKKTLKISGENIKPNKKVKLTLELKTNYSIFIENKISFMQKIDYM